MRTRETPISAGRLPLGLITFCPKQGPNLELLQSFLAPFSENHAADWCHQQLPSAQCEPHQGMRQRRKG